MERLLAILSVVKADYDRLARGLSKTSYISTARFLDVSGGPPCGVTASLVTFILTGKENCEQVALNEVYRRVEHEELVTISLWGSFGIGPEHALVCLRVGNAKYAAVDSYVGRRRMDVRLLTASEWIDWLNALGEFVGGPPKFEADLKGWEAITGVLLEEGHLSIRYNAYCEACPLDLAGVASRMKGLLARAAQK